MKEHFKDRILKKPLVFDGAMGTLLYLKGIFINRNFDELNLSRPDMIQRIHSEYIQAGAGVIQTNTFGANRAKLSKYGLENQVQEINWMGVKIARESAGDSVYVAGSMGPTGIIPDIYSSGEMEKIRKIFLEQASAILSQSPDLIILETFRFLAEMKIALETVKSLSDIPVLAQMAFDEEEKVADGMGPEKVASYLKEWGSDLIGTNCGEGPSIAYSVCQKMLSAGLPVVAQPNAGRPRRVEERVMYMATPEYFGEYARRFLRSGITILGGCCGTTPEHIRHIASQVRMFSGGKIEILDEEKTAENGKKHALELIPLPVEKKSPFGEKLKKKFIICVEIDPPAGLDSAKAIEGARKLKDAGIDAVNIADGPRATARMSNASLALKIEKEVGLETIVHVTCRDRNLLGIQADLIGLHSLGLRNLLIITGDPSKLGDYPQATTVYDLDSIGLLKLVSKLNRGIDPAGKSIRGQTEFCMGCGAEPASQDYQREIKRLGLKVEAGAEYIMTQPVFEIEVFRKFIGDTKHLNVPVIAGILPLISFRNAEFLHNEVPGMQIPEQIRERMKNAGKGQEAQEQGIRIAGEILLQIKDLVQGIYIMPPFDRYDTAIKVAEVIK
jgi:homocysteine S-methyltransferase